MPGVEIEKLTWREYMELPDAGPRYQLINGVLCMSPSPNRYHQVISRNLQYLIMRHLEDHPDGELFDAPFDVYISEFDVFQPDLLFVREDRRGLLEKKGLVGAPDWVVEILSPSTASLDKRDKRDNYARYGVRELWIIDPELRRIHVYDLPQNPAKPVASYDEGETITPLTIPGLILSVDRIFKDRSPDSRAA